MKYARQRDVNEKQIVEELEAAGYAVQRLDGAGVPDLLVGLGDSLWLLEVKNPDAKGGGKYNTGEGCLTAAQVKWWSRWKGPAPKIVRSAAEALEAIGARRWTPSVERPLKMERMQPSDYACTCCGEAMTRWEDFEEFQHASCGGLVTKRGISP